jgi:hypothetical protein
MRAKILTFLQRDKTSTGVGQPTNYPLTEEIAEGETDTHISAYASGVTPTLTEVRISPLKSFPFIIFHPTYGFGQSKTKV